MREVLHFAFRHVRVQLEHALLDPAAVADQHRNDESRPEPRQVEVAEMAPLQARRKHGRRVPREVRQDVGGAHQLGVEVGRLAERVVQLTLLALGQLRRTDVVDEPAVPLVGRDAAGAGVRLSEVSELLEQRHVVADGRAGYVETVTADEVLGPDRLAGSDVFANDRRQDRRLPGPERAFRDRVGHDEVRLALGGCEC